MSAGKYLANAIECTSNCPISTTQFPTYDRNHVSGAFYADLNVTTKFEMSTIAMADVPIHFAIDDMQIAEDLQLVVGHMVMQYLYEHRPNKG